MDVATDEITIQDLQAHSRRFGKKATHKLLMLLGKRRPLYDLVMSEGGQLLFQRLIQRLDEILDKIVADTATEKEHVEYKVRLEFLRDATDNLVNYKKYRDMLKGKK